MVMSNYQHITKQSRYRALTAAGLRYDGLTFKEIGQHMGSITVETARQAARKGQRILTRDYAALNFCAQHANTLPP